MENVTMTASITIEEATTNLLDLIDRVGKGEEITILKDGQQIARLVPPLPTLPPRVPGTAIGMITIAPDFDEPLPDDILAAFEA
jgi:antitoxin (DNA-binding transcriptional repressor) of toxin-antitoxin stability system